ncbi:unnamed protein product [Fusarium graminearum]|nr:unnamed protein product [Fusarium graminearum]
MPQRGAQKLPYTLLDGAIRLDDEGLTFNRLLGLVTTNLSRPLDSCRPESPFSAKDHTKKPLYPPNAVECTDVDWLLENSVEKSAKAELTSLLTLWGGHRNQQGNTYSTTLLRQVEIFENPTTRIKELLEIPEYLQGVRELLSHQTARGEKGELGVITGFITCSDMAFNRDSGITLDLGASAGIPSEQVTGVPGTDVLAQASLKKTRQRKISGIYKGEVVVACYYFPIRRIMDSQPQGHGFSIFKLLPGMNSANKKRDRFPTVGEEPLEIHDIDVIDNCMNGNMHRPLGGPLTENLEAEGSSPKISESSKSNEELYIRIGTATAKDGIEFQDGSSN